MIDEILLLFIKPESFWYYVNINGISVLARPESLWATVEFSIAVIMPIATAFTAYKIGRSIGRAILFASLIASVFLIIDFFFIAPLFYKELAQAKPFFYLLMYELPFLVVGLLLSTFYDKNKVEPALKLDNSLIRAGVLFIKTSIFLILLLYVYLVFASIL